jgi:hypothetical protein
VGDGATATSPSIGGTVVVVGTLQTVNAAVTTPRITSQTKNLAIFAVIYKSFLVMDSGG